MRRTMLPLVLAVGVAAVTAPALADTGAAPPKKLDVFVYADAVNGTRPAAAKPRPIGCTQSNIFTRGEQVVFRTWGTEALTGDILSTENVKYAYVKVPGAPNMKLNWGAHGATSNRVWFWSAPYNLPADFPLGSATFTVVFKTTANAFGMYDHVITVVPAAKKR